MDLGSSFFRSAKSSVEERRRGLRKVPWLGDQDPTARLDSSGWRVGFRGLGFRGLGFRVLGFRGLGFRV